MARVLVTGSSRGIGRAIALRLAQDDWSVVVHYAQARSDADSLALELGDRCAGVLQADLGELDQADRLAHQALELGIDALVNNAGIYVQSKLLDPTAFDDYTRCHRVNFESPLRLIRACCQAFAERGGGKVVNVASRVGHRGEAGAAAYSTSKAALINLTRALAVEHASLDIGHFAIAPGWVETAMAREGMGDRLPKILADIPLGRMASPEDCAAAVAFLLREEAAYLSGIVIDINGASYLR